MRLIDRVERSQAKRIRVFENGNNESLGTEVVISPMHQKTWLKVLQQVSDVLKPSFHVVHHIISVPEARSVHSFSDLTHGEVYVACGNKKQLNQRSQESVRKRNSRLEKQQNTHKKSNWALLQAAKNKLTVIYVFINGAKDKPHMKFVLTERDLIQWESTRKFMSNMLDQPQGIHDLYTVYGDIVTKSWHLLNGGSYVAVGNGEKFQLLDYTNNFPHFIENTKRETKSVNEIPKLSFKHHTATNFGSITDRPSRRISDGGHLQFIMEEDFEKEQRSASWDLLKNNTPLLENQFKIDNGYGSIGTPRSLYKM